MSRESEKSKMVAIGTNDQVLPFTAIGADTIEVDSKEEALDALEKSVEGYVIIILSDDYWEQCRELIEVYSGKPVPAIISMPGKDGTTSAFSGMLNSLVRRAIGMDIQGGME